MRKLARTTTALLSAGALTAAIAVPTQAATPGDITVPLGGDCVINVTQLRPEGNCLPQFVVGGGAIALLAALAFGSAGSSVGQPPVTPTPDPDPNPDPDPDPNPSSGPLDPANYQIESAVSPETGFGVVGVSYIGTIPDNPGLYELRQVDDIQGEFTFNPDTPLTEGLGGVWLIGETGEFTIVYKPVGDTPVDVVSWSYGK